MRSAEIGSAIDNIGTAAPVSGPSFTAPSFGAAPSLVSEFGPKGPVTAFSLKETMPYTININNLGNYEIKPFTKVNVEPEVSVVNPPVFNVADVISEAETILAEARTLPKVNLDPEALLPAHISNPAEVIEVTSEIGRRPSIRAQSLLMLVAARVFSPIALETETATVPDTTPHTEINAQPSTAFQSEQRPVYIQTQTEPVISASFQPEEVEEEETQKKRTEPEEERVEELVSSHKVHKKVAQKRIHKIDDLGKQVEAEIKKEGNVGPIPGQRIFDYLVALNPREYRGGELEITDPEGTLPDGTWEANMENVKKETFASAKEVAQKAPEIVALDNPLTKGLGDQVPQKNLDTTYKHAKSKIHPVHQVIKRVSKMKSMQGSKGQNITFLTEHKQANEGRIQDHPALAQALKAA